MAWFACLISRHILMSPLGFSTTTKGLTQLVGPSTFSITSSFNKSSSFSVTFSLLLKGILRRGCATGRTLSSMCSLSWYPLSFPRPWKTFGNFAFREAFLSACSALLLTSSDLVWQLFMDTPTLKTPSNSDASRPNSVAALSRVT